MTVKFCNYCNTSHPFDRDHWSLKRGKLALCKIQDHHRYINRSNNRKRTPGVEDIRQRVFDVHGDVVTLKCDQVYKNNSQILVFIDNVYGEYESDVRTVCRGRRHPQYYIDRSKEREVAKLKDRAGKRRRLIFKITEGEFKNKLFELFGNQITLVGSYINQKTKTVFKDEEYGEWTSTPSSVLRGTSHPERAKLKRIKKQTLTVEQIKDRISKKHGNLVSWKEGQEYVTCTDSAIFVDKDYGEWTTRVSTVIHCGKSHPARYCSKSRAEDEVREFIESLGIPTTKINGVKGGYEIDIYSPELNVGVEYHGLYWHCELNKDKNYHLEKKKWFDDTYGGKLIQIFENEWSDQKDQVKSRLKSIFGVNREKIFARKCTIARVSDGDACELINKYHLQPVRRDKNSVNIGLYFGGDLLCVGRFTKHHRSSSKIVLSRFVCKEGLTVVGGLGRISSAAMKIFNSEIYTWVDLRWGNPDGYIKSGWTVDGELKPDYFYYKHIGNKVISKQSRKRGAVGTPVGVTEHEHALSDGLYRVWDCGKVRLSLVPDKD